MLVVQGRIRRKAQQEKSATETNEQRFLCLFIFPSQIFLSFRLQPWVTSEALAGFSGDEHFAPPRIKSSTRLPNLDFQFQIDGKFLGDGFLNATDELFDVFTGGAGFRDDKVCVPLTDPRRTDGQAF